VNVVKNYVPLRDYCRQNHWPRLSQWHHWIYNQAPIARQCVKKIGGRYLIDVSAFEGYVDSATLVEDQSARRAM